MRITRGRVGMKSPVLERTVIIVIVIRPNTEILLDFSLLAYAYELVCILYDTQWTILFPFRSVHINEIWQSEKVILTEEMPLCQSLRRCSIGLLCLPVPCFCIYYSWAYFCMLVLACHLLVIKWATISPFSVVMRATALPGVKTSTMRN